MKSIENRSPQNIILESRNNLRVSGVKDIDNFSETKIVIDTTLGELVIKGEDLHIISLEKESGDLSLTGKVSSLIYSSLKGRENIFRRIFR